MRKQEKWIKWEPITNLSPKYDIVSVHDGKNGIKINFCDTANDQNTIDVVYDGWAAAYRWADETYVNAEVQNLFKEYGSDFFTKWTFFKVTDSQYLEYVSKASGGISDFSQLIHFVFFTDDGLLEVLAPYEPIFELTNARESK